MPRPRRLPQRQIQQVISVPPPVNGLNTTGQYAGMPPTDAVDMDNIVATEMGVTVRSGWREYATNIDLGNLVRTVMARVSAPASALAAPLVGSELFAATDHGFYNIEGGGDMTGRAPAMALSGVSYAGYCNWVQYTAGSGA